MAASPDFVNSAAQQNSLDMPTIHASAVANENSQRYFRAVMKSEDITPFLQTPLLCES
jgi:hypothetical protein